MKKNGFYIIIVGLFVLAGCGTDCSKSTASYKEGYSNGQIAATSGEYVSCDKYLELMDQQGMHIDASDCFREGFSDAIGGKKSQYPEEKETTQENNTTPSQNQPSVNNTPQPPPVVNINTESDCLNYLKGRTFNSGLNKIVVSDSLKVSIYKTSNNSLGFTGTLQLGNVIDNSNRILEIHSSGNNNGVRFFLYPDGTLQGSDASGMKYNPQQAVQRQPMPDSSSINQENAEGDADKAELKAKKAK